jgi:hypothetical protein
MAGVLVDDLLDLCDGNLGEEGWVEPRRLEGTGAKNARDGLLGSDRRGSLSECGERDKKGDEECEEGLHDHVFPGVGPNLGPVTTVHDNPA